MIRWQNEKDRLETAAEVKEILTANISDHTFEISHLNEWRDEFLDTYNYKIDTITENNKDIDERVTFFYTKIEREEFFDVND